MKWKTWIAGLLSVAAFGLAAEQASAWFCHCCKGCCTTICCRPYNAFTPCCFGSICCDGCCPVQCGGGHGGFCGGFDGGYGGGYAGGAWNPAFATPSYGPPNFAGYPGVPYFAGPEAIQGPPPASTPPPATPVNTSSLNGQPLNGQPVNGQPLYGQPYMYQPYTQQPYAPPTGGVRPANYPAGYYPNFWPAYPMGYWTSAYAPGQNGSWGVPYGR